MEKVRLLPLYIVAVALAGRAQELSATRISTVPDGVVFTVDGQSYNHAVSIVWPKGSKHTLAVPPDTFGPAADIKYAFAAWQWSGGTLTGNPVTITADPAITQYTGNFGAQYGLHVIFYSCGNTPGCIGPNQVIVNGSTITSDQTIYFAPGTAVVLQATPGPGFVFTGWGPGIVQTSQGFQATVTMTSPTSVYPMFYTARRISFASEPSGLQVLADRGAITTPTTLEWGFNTVHTLSVISPQRDLTGNQWAFKSWSDGGAAIHSYTVAPRGDADLITAKFVPAASVMITTAPTGLSMTVDGRSNWPNSDFLWGVGETHVIDAPAKQTDEQGRVWVFSGWSNGAPQTQNFTVPDSAAPAGVRLVATYTQIGHLVVSSSLSGIAVYVNGNPCALPCDVQPAIGSKVTVSAPATVPAGPGTRQDLAGWSNGAGPGDLELTVGTDAVSVSALYRQMNYLAAGSAPSGSASWSMQPGSPDGYYDAQTNVAVSVTPRPGYRFRAWNGDLTGTSPSGMVSMAAPRTVQAMMEAVPFIAPTGVANAAGVTPQSGVAAGSIVSIFGANLATGTVLGPTSPLSQTLGGAAVRVGERLLPLIFVSAEQINAQLPADLKTGDQKLVVSTEGQPDVETAFTIVQNAPGLFQQAIDSVNYAVAAHADGSPVNTAAPARIGEQVTVYGTGFGPTNPVRPEGFPVPASPAYTLLDSASVQLGSASVAASAFAQPGGVGVDAVRFTVPKGASGTTAITVTVNGAVSNCVQLPVE